MRILHVLGERGFSGGENQLLATIRHLAAAGHQQLLVGNVRGVFHEQVRELGVEIHLQKFRSNYDLIGAFSLRRKFRALRPDLIHFACSRSHKVGGLACAFAGKLPPRVVTRRMDYKIGNTAFRRWLYQRAVDAVVVISQGVREAVLAIGTDPARVHTINEGVDTQSLGKLADAQLRAEARRARGLDETVIYGVTTASLHPRKAHRLLLEALQGLRIPTGQRLLWLCAGEGPEKEALRQQARGMPEGVEVQFPGQINDVPQALAAADLFCLNSNYEGLGVALLEAVASGTACVATHVGGMREVFVDGESGLHVPVGEVPALRAALQRLVDDPELRARLAAAGRQRAVERFDIGLMGRKTEALYQQLVDAAGSGPRGQG